MSHSSSHMSENPRFESQEELVPQARPPATAFSLGALLILIIGSAVAILFLIPPSDVKVNLRTIGIPLSNDVPLSTVIAASGAAIGMIGFIFLVSGNARRLRLIYDFTSSAYELNARLARRGEERNSPSEVYLLREYEDALLRLGAYEQARLVSRLIEQNGGLEPSYLWRRRRLVP